MSNHFTNFRYRFAEIILACCNKKLKDIDIKWKNKKSVCIVLCSNGYPDNYKKNIIINGLKNLKIEKRIHISCGNSN